MWLQVFVVALFIIAIYYFRNQKANKRVTIVVLGDIGRSPRMQYHAISFAKEGFDVDFIGYRGVNPSQEILSNKKIHMYHIREPPAAVLKLPRLFVYLVKIVWRSFALFLSMMLVKKPSYLLCQNPPAIPTLAICSFVTMIRGSRYIIDWHNYGYTILGLSLGRLNPITKVAYWYEKIFGRLSHANICVTQAMREDLKTNWKIDAVTMYDKAPDHFRRTGLVNQHAVCTKLADTQEVFRMYDDQKTCTAFTEVLPDGTMALRAARPALLLSSTSWTADEDFSILLDALQLYENCKADEASTLPELVCVITGKGPLRDHYRREIGKRCWEHVSICTPWLEAEDYPKLLGFADVGVCLHKSSSGLDLPMKVVDMFGCGLPVCAVGYNCLGELVKHQKNGLVFKTSEELAAQIQELLAGFPNDCRKLESLREEVKTFQKMRWDKEWKRAVLPLLY